MKIICSNKQLLQAAIHILEKLNVKELSDDHHLYIKRLPPKHKLKGFIDYPQISLDQTVDYNIYIKLDDERYVTLAHELVHFKQIVEKGRVCEKEAYKLEKSLTMTL